MPLASRKPPRATNLPPEAVGDRPGRYLHEKAHEHEPGLECEDLDEAQPAPLAEEGDDHSAHQMHPAQEAHGAELEGVPPEAGERGMLGAARAARLCHARESTEQTAGRAVVLSNPPRRMGHVHPRAWTGRSR